MSILYGYDRKRKDRLMHSIYLWKLATGLIYFNYWEFSFYNKIQIVYSFNLNIGSNFSYLIKLKMKSISVKLTHGHYLKGNLDQHGKIIAEYVWIDGSGIGVRSKCRTLTGAITDISQLPEWNYDGSSTEQATTENSEVILKPVAYFPDPFRGGDNTLVMCSTYKWANAEKTDLTPTNTNFRHFAEPIFKLSEDHHPWFGIEQEYTLFEWTNAFTRWPLGWPEGGYPSAQGPYYCSVGATVCYGRIVMDLHYKACLAAKITISGTNGEVMPGQWEFQIGPCEGI